MENFVLIVILSILALYFFSSTNVYKSLYKKTNEEKDIIDEEMKKLQKLIDKYDKQVKVGVNTLRNNQETLQIARDDLQKLKLENMNLKQRITQLETRNEELYAQVNTIV